MGTQMSAPARIASHTGHPESVASFAAVKAPIPASVTCASESMPPSPMTTVKVRNSDRERDALADHADPEVVEPERDREEHERDCDMVRARHANR